MRKINTSLFLIVCLFSYAASSKSNYSESKPPYQLSSPQMSLIEGAGGKCDAVDWILTLASWAVCVLVPEPYSCLIAMAGTDVCLSRLQESPPAGSSPGGVVGGGPIAPKCPCPM